MTTFIKPVLCLYLALLSIGPGQFEYSSNPLSHVDILNLLNEQVLDFAIEEDGLLTLKGLRTLAMMHTAIHDALNSIDGRYKTYLPVKSLQEADPLATLAQAAYEVVSHSFPDKKGNLQKQLSEWLVKCTAVDARNAGMQLGRSVAQEVIKLRSNDGWDGEEEYQWHPMAPGVYAEFKEHSGTPEGFIFGAGWASAQPFMLTHPSHFRSPPPPEINSIEYAKAFEEVKTYGRHEGSSRTADQSHLAMWWKDFIENSHNRLARMLIVKEKLNLWDAARLFALLNMTIYDAYICVFDNKFHYNHWRPYTAIRWASNDGNDSTISDETWNNLHRHTYAFPSYPSAHGTASSAAMKVLANTLGVGDKYEFTMTTREVDRAGPFSGKIKMEPAMRSFGSFSEAALEASMSRVYLGIHFRYDSEEGFRLGNRIGSYAINHFFQKVIDAPDR